MGGRPTDYRESHVKDALTICEQGATLPELADCFGVTVRTIYRWSHRYPAFCHAIAVGKKAADDRVERGLYHRAVGFETTEIRQKYEVKQNEDGTDKRVLVSEDVVTKQLAPDTVAATTWLRNRRPDEWRDRHEFVGKDGNDLFPDNVPLRDLAIKLVSIIERANETGEQPPAIEGSAIPQQH